MVKTMIGRLVLPLLLLVSAAPVLALTQIQASVNQNPVVMGQSFELLLEADDSVDQNIDLSPLETDFEIYRSNVSQSTQIVNFDMKQQTRWQIALLPKRLGMATIPAITIDGVQSNPIQLQVVKQSGAADQLKPVKLEVSLSSDEIWLGQPVAINVRLLLAADLQRGNLEAPDHPDVQLRQLGQDRNSTEIVDGRRVQVISRDYVAIPQRSGQIELGTINFAGDLRMGGNRNNFFGGGRSQTYVLNSDPIELQVNPQPPHYQGDWLAADLVTLTANELTQTEYEAGQPITLNLSISAVGTVAEALPSINIDPIDTVRIYPDKPERDGGTQNGQLIARLNQSVALVPQQAGDFTIPEIRIPWWNAKLKRQEWATLPPQTIKVKPSSVASSEPPTLPVAPTQPNQTTATASPWQWQLSTALFAILWLATLVWGWQRGKRVVAQPTPSTSHVKSNTIEADLLRACRHNNAQEAINLLPQWGSEHLGQPVTLDQVAQQLPQLAGEIAKLQQSRYGQQAAAWTGQVLAEAIATLPQPKVQANDTLPPLNPS